MSRAIPVLCLGIVFSHCDLKGPVPAYIHVAEFEVNVSPGQGSSSSRITEGWVFANGEFLGSYSLPANVPIVAEGLTDIRVAPGIKVNGINSTPDIYPFYTRYQLDINLAPGRVDTIRPTTAYTSSAKFSFFEDFETSNSFIDIIDDDPETKLIPIEGDDVFEGTRSGYIRLDADHPVIEIANLPVLDDIPINGTAVYLEFDYRTNVQLGVGLLGSAAGFPPQGAIVLVLREKDEWNKMYMELSPTLLASGFPGYQILLSALHNPGNVESEVFLDNFKIVQIDQ